MLIMQSTKIPFQDLADRIASDFFEKGISLEDGVVRIATERDMLPEEVRRLAEKSNTAASILYLKNSKDKKGAFTLANADVCVGRTHPVDSREVEETAEKDSAGLEVTTFKTASEFPVTRREILEKRASVNEVSNVSLAEQVSVKPRQEKKAEEYTLHDVCQLKIEVDKARQAKIASELRMQSCLNTAVNTFQYRSAEAFDKFASDAVAVCGDSIAPVLSSIGEYLKYDVTFEKGASVVDDTKSEMVNMRKLAQELRDYPAVCESLEALEQELARFNNTIIEQYVTL